MRLYLVKIGGVEFKLASVSCERGMKKGLAGSKKLKPKFGMLFNFKEPQDVVMNMEEMNYSIDMLFVNKDMRVVRAVMMPKGAKPIMTKDILYVIELNKGEGKELLHTNVEFGESLKEHLKEVGEHHEEVHEEHKHDRGHSGGVNIIIKVETVPEGMKERFKKGGTIDLIEDEVKAISGKMQVLDDKGKVLMNITGGERIFSIQHTKTLVDLAEQVKEGTASPEELGKEVKNILHIQNTQEPEYV